MASQGQIAEAMNAMQRQIAELAGQLAEEHHRDANLNKVAQVLDRWTTQQAQQPVARLVDTRGIGRPSNFGSGKEKELGEELPSVAKKDAELHHQCVPRSSGTARVGSDDSSAHHSSTRRPKIRLRSRSHGSSDGSRGQDALSLCGADACDRR